MWNVSLEGIFVGSNDPDDTRDATLLRSVNLNKVLKLRPPGSSGWRNGFLVFFIGQVITTLLGFVVYNAVIKHRKTQLSFLVAYGFIFPLCAYMPYAIISATNTDNMIVCFGLMKPFLHSIFRTSEALHGFSPAGSELSLKSYLIYFTALGEVKYDEETKEPIRPTRKSILTKVIQLHVGLVVLGLYSSILYHRDFALFDTVTTDSSFFPVPVRQTINNIANAILMQVYLSVLPIPESLIANLFFNVEVIDILHNPMFSSTSVSDFWGKKWNLVIHGMLKRGVFQPARKYMSSKLAVLWTFLISGVTHEWIITILFVAQHKYNCDNSLSTFQCIAGNIHINQTKFFLWNGMVVGLESLLHRTAYMKTIRKKIPSWILTLCMWLLISPVGHWYFDDYVQSGFFHHGQLGIPTLILEEL